MAGRGRKVFVMSSFFSNWALLKPQGEYKRRYQACERLWSGYPPDLQRRIYDFIREAQQKGLQINPNPYFAIEDTALALQQQPYRRTLSYSEYYARYHTTEERDGWKMTNPTGQKVIYVRAN